MVAVVQAARGAAVVNVPLLVLGIALLVVALAGHEVARQRLTTLCFIFCAILAARYSFRLPLPFSNDSVLYVVPAAMLLALATATALRSTSPTPRTLPAVAVISMLASLLGYACLSRLYSLEGVVLHAVILNCSLAIAACLSIASPRRSFSFALSAALLLAGIAPALRSLLP
jgi:hypothetical protein